MVQVDVLEEFPVVPPVANSLRVGTNGAALLMGISCSHETILEESASGTGEMTKWFGSCISGH